MGVSRQRVHQLLARGRIKGAQRVGFDGRWAIPIKVVILPAKNGRPRK